MSSASWSAGVRFNQGGPAEGRPRVAQNTSLQTRACCALPLASPRAPAVPSRTSDSMSETKGS
eukprot:7691604-Pyramimonas_sp.AAC.1